MLLPYFIPFVFYPKSKLVINTQYKMPVLPRIESPIPALVFFETDISWKIPSQTIDNQRAIGEHIKKRRLDLKLFQPAVAKILGVATDTITYWETGRSKPQIQFYPKLIEFLGYNPLALESTTFGSRLWNYRVKNGLSYKRLGKILGIDPATLVLWESNKKMPSGSKKLRLAAFGIV